MGWSSVDGGVSSSGGGDGSPPDPLVAAAAYNGVPMRSAPAKPAAATAHSIPDVTSL
jgi:hypothetical protein